MHRTGTKHIVRHMQKSVVQWSVLSKFTCSCICGVVNPEIEGILLGYGKEDPRELERDLVSEIERQAFFNARDKVFDLAKDKIPKCSIGEML